MPARRPNHYVGEWFGQRIFPVVQSGPESLSVMRDCTCPFLSAALETKTQCNKNAKSLGVCTITSSNARRYGRDGAIDWLVCPYRTLDDNLLDEVVTRLFDVPRSTPVLVVAAPTLRQEQVRDRVAEALAEGDRVFAYFRAAIGGEISLAATARSPEFAFDVALVEIENNGDQPPTIGKFAVVEVQTMEFHGSYGKATDALRQALDLHGRQFGEQVSINPEWAGRGIQGPSIADTFKRTFYQMIFKFQLGTHDQCAGTVLALPLAVWNTWQPHLGGMPVEPDKRDPLLFTTRRPKGVKLTESAVAWIVVFDIDMNSGEVPNPLKIDFVVQTDVATLLHYAFDVAPEAAFEGGSIGNVYGNICGKVAALWPELAHIGAGD